MAGVKGDNNDTLTFYRLLDHTDINYGIARGAWNTRRKHNNVDLVGLRHTVVHQQFHIPCVVIHGERKMHDS